MVSSLLRALITPPYGVEHQEGPRTMGLDDLPRFVAALFLAFALFSVFIGGGTIVASFLAWKWSVRLVAAGRSASPARVMNAIVLAASALPAGLGFAPMLASRPSPGSLVLFAVLGGCSLLATVHAAYREECIRRLRENLDLAQNLESIPYAAGRDERIRQVLEASNVTDFSGAARRRALVRSLCVVAAWGAAGMVLALTGNAHFAGPS
jgi:hypothetical protein